MQRTCRRANARRMPKGLKSHPELCERPETSHLCEDDASVVCQPLVAKDQRAPGTPSPRGLLATFSNTLSGKTQA